MDISLELKIVVGRRFTNGHHTVGGEEEDRNNHKKNHMKDFKRSRNMKEDRAG